MTDTARALLRAITGHGLTDPDAIRAAWADDTPRLAYADLVEEEGDGARAEFIRVQVELARWTDGNKQFCESLRMFGLTDGGRKRFPDLARMLDRQKDLLTPRHVADWCGDALAPMVIDRVAERTLYGRRELPEYPIEFSRGFVSRLTCSWQSWRDHADAIRAAHPVEEVVLTTMPNVESRGQSGWGIYSPLGRWDRMRITEKVFKKHEIARRGAETYESVLLRLTWPAITFTLPAEREWQPGDWYSTNPAASPFVQLEPRE